MKGVIIMKKSLLPKAVKFSQSQSHEYRSVHSTPAQCGSTCGGGANI